MLVAGLALGSIFYDLGEDKVAERVGLFAFLLTFLLSSTTEALPIFLQEREILAKDTSSGAYRVSSYAVANVVVFLPFQLALAVVFAAPVYWLAGLRRTAAAFGYFLLVVWLILYTANSVVVCFAAAAPDFVVGNAAIQGVMGSFFLFSGYFIARSAMPVMSQRFFKNAAALRLLDGVHAGGGAGAGLHLLRPWSARTCWSA
jgi:hypothetical protein